MHPQTVYAKTSKGVLEIKNKTVKLDRNAGGIFLSVDGKSTVAELVVPLTSIEMLASSGKLILDAVLI